MYDFNNFKMNSEYIHFISHAWVMMAASHYTGFTICVESVFNQMKSFHTFWKQTQFQTSKNKIWSVGYYIYINACDLCERNRI